MKKSRIILIFSLLILGVMFFIPKDEAEKTPESAPKAPVDTIEAKKSIAPQEKESVEQSKIKKASPAVKLSEKEKLKIFENILILFLNDQ